MAIQVQIAIGALTTPVAGFTPAVSLASPATPGNKIVVTYKSENDVRNTVAVAGTGVSTYARVGTSFQGGSGTISMFQGTAADANGGHGVVFELTGNHGDQVQVTVAEWAGLDDDQSEATSIGAEVTGLSHGCGPLDAPNTSGVAYALAMRGNRTYDDDPNYTPLATGSVRFYEALRNNPPASDTLAYTSDSSTNSVSALFILVGASGPTIDSVNSDDTVEPELEGYVTEGAGFDDPTPEIRQGAVTVEQTRVSYTGSEIVQDMVFDAGVGPHLKYGDADYAVVNADDSEATLAITIGPEAGATYVDIDTPDPEASNRITAVPDIESGDQLKAYNVVGGTIDDVTLLDDATFIAAVNVISFRVRCWRVATATWGTPGTQSLAGSSMWGQVI